MTRVGIGAASSLTIVGTAMALFGIGLLAGWIDPGTQALRWVAGFGVLFPAAYFLALGYSAWRYMVTGKAGATPAVLASLARFLSRDLTVRSARPRRRR